MNHLNPCKLNLYYSHACEWYWLHFSWCQAGGSGFKSDSALMDFGQSSPEDEDLYSTRSWETASQRCHLICINKLLASLSCVNRPNYIEVVFYQHFRSHFRTKVQKVHLHFISNAMNSSKPNYMCKWAEIWKKKKIHPQLFNSQMADSEIFSPYVLFNNN